MSEYFIKLLYKPPSYPEDCNSTPTTVSIEQYTIFNFKLHVANMTEKKEANNLTPVPSQDGQVCTHDAVFGEITEDGPNYRNVCILEGILTLADW